MPASANRWRPGRRVGLAGLLLAALSPLLVVSHAGATSPAWTAGTVFIADQGSAGGGALWQLPPGGGPGFLESGSVQSVATDAGGDAFWTDCNGFVEELPAGGSPILLTTASCPTGIAVDASGDVFFGAFGVSGVGGQGLYEIPSGGSPVLVTSGAGEFSSIAIDGNGDIWGAGSAAHLVLVPHGTSTAVVVTVPSYGYINGVDLNGSNDLFVSAGPYDVAAKLPVGGGPSVSYGTGLSYATGVVVDGGGDVFIGQPATSPGFGKVVEVASGGSQSVVASGITYVTGLAIWPPLAPAARATSSTALTSSSPSTVTTQTPVHLTATVSPAGGRGTVQFSDSGRPFGNPVATNGSGVAHLTTTLSQGNHQLTATYLGDASNAPSISNSLPFTATPIKTKTVLTTPGGTTVPGDQPVSVTATVTGKGGIPTGDVEFTVNGNVVASAALDSGGQATQSVSLPPGTSKVKALYQGDSTFATSTSNAIMFTTTPPFRPSVSTTVSYGRPRGNLSEKATIHVKVTGVTGNGAPTGTVTADDGFTCTVLTPIAGKLVSTATCTNIVANGTFEDVQVSYSGDSTYDPASTFQSVSVGGGKARAGRRL